MRNSYFYTWVHHRIVPSDTYDITFFTTVLKFIYRIAEEVEWVIQEKGRVDKNLDDFTLFCPPCPKRNKESERICSDSFRFLRLLIIIRQQRLHQKDKRQRKYRNLRKNWGR